MTLEALARMPRARIWPVSTISSKARANRKSPTRTLDGAPQIRWAATLPRRRSEVSTTSSCSRVAVWMNSTAAASLTGAEMSPAAPEARAAARVSRGRNRLPPAEMRCSASRGMTGTCDCIRSRIRASTVAMSGAASRTSGSTFPFERGSATVTAANGKLIETAARGRIAPEKPAAALPGDDAAHNGDRSMKGQAA